MNGGSPSGLYGWDRFARTGHAETRAEQARRLRNRELSAAAHDEADRLMDEMSRAASEDDELIAPERQERPASLGRAAGFLSPLMPAADQTPAPRPSSRGARATPAPTSSSRSAPGANLHRQQRG